MLPALGRTRRGHRTRPQVTDRPVGTEPVTGHRDSPVPAARIGVIAKTRRVTGCLRGGVAR